MAARLHCDAWRNVYGRRAAKLDPVKIVFNVFSMMANAIALSYFAIIAGKNLRRGHACCC